MHDDTLPCMIAVKVEREQGANKRPGFVMKYVVKSPRGKRVIRKFFYGMGTMGEKKRQMVETEHLLENVLMKVLDEKTTSVRWAKKPSEIKSEVSHVLAKIFKSEKSGRLVSKMSQKKPQGGEQQQALAGGGGGQLGKEGKEERGGSVEEGDENNMEGVRRNDPLMPANQSIFECEKESANTKVFLAPSFSGKTTLMVDELNKLVKRNKLEDYDKILLFTESTAATPLKRLDPKVRKKMMIYDRFVPQFVRVLKKINTVTNNRFRFLILMDDCIDLKGGILIKLILTLRNVNISTVISIQYSKLLAKSQRQSIHDYYLINMHLEDLEYLMSGFLAPHFRELFINEGMGSREEIHKLNYRKLTEMAMTRLKDRILHFDQRHDRITIYTRPPPPKDKKGGKKKKEQEEAPNPGRPQQHEQQPKEEKKGRGRKKLDMV